MNRPLTVQLNNTHGGNKMNEKKFAQTVIELLPGEWTKVIGYGEIEEKEFGEIKLYFRKVFFYVYTKNNDEPIITAAIPERFGMEENTYERLRDQLRDNLKELWDEFNGNGQEPWKSLTFVIDEFGKFHVDYSYEDLDGSFTDRFKIWKKKHIGAK